MAKAKETPKPDSQPRLVVATNMIVMKALGDVTAIAHEDKQYTVVDGKVALPAGETWWHDLIGYQITWLVEA